MAEEHERQDDRGSKSPHVDAEMKEANIGVFESGAAPRYVGQPSGPPVELDPDAVQAPGGDSRPDNIDPATAEFTDVSDSQMMHTTREPEVLPELHRERAAEYDARRSTDNLEIVGRPLGPNDEEIAVLIENDGPQEDSGRD
jgi:hypothetical protein